MLTRYLPPPPSQALHEARWCSVMQHLTTGSNNKGPPVLNHSLWGALMLQAKWVVLMFKVKWEVPMLQAKWGVLMHRAKWEVFMHQVKWVVLWVDPICQPRSNSSRPCPNNKKCRSSHLLINRKDSKDKKHNHKDSNSRKHLLISRKCSRSRSLWQQHLWLLQSL